MIPGSSSTFSTFEKPLSEGFFARHETFCPRYGWLKKGFDAVLDDSEIFDAPDAIERLGVGKNMVRSIRFGCMAFHLIEPDAESGQRRLSGRMRVTPFGKALLSDDGWDPFSTPGVIEQMYPVEASEYERPETGSRSASCLRSHVQSGVHLL